MDYITLIILTMAIGGFMTWYCNHNLKKYSQVASVTNITGYQAAQMMLSAHGVSGVRVYEGAEGHDHFNPTDNSISLSPSVFRSTSITAVATACHEVGHACQFAEGYSPMRIRSALVPAVNLAQNAWIFVFFAGIFFNLMGLVTLAIALYAVAIVFHLVTLPVELNASHRAMDYISSLGVPQTESGSAFTVLRACALTYVGAALISILNLLYYLQFINNDN